MKALYRSAAVGSLCCLGQVSPAQAYVVLEVCAEYKNTGSKYRMEATVIDGSELNREWNTYDFASFSKYVLLFWADDQMSIIKLDYSFGIGAFGSDGVDQRGYEWNISTSTMFCM